MSAAIPHSPPLRPQNIWPKQTRPHSLATVCVHSDDNYEKKMKQFVYWSQWISENQTEVRWCAHISGHLFEYTCKSNDYSVRFRHTLTWGLQHLTWTAWRSTWRHTIKECLPSEQLWSLWDVTASVEVQPIGSNRLRLCCWPSKVYTLNWLRLTVQGKASPGGRHEWQKKKDA